MERHAAALSACEALVRRHDPDRYFAALFAPAPKRALLFALYAFAYEIARIAENVHEPMLGEIRRQWWREAVDGAAQGAPRRHDVVEALAALFAQSDVPPERLVAMIDAREADMAEDGFAALGALEAYADATSGEIMRIAARILGAGEAYDDMARDAGIAYGLTGLLRAVPFHASQGKCYLPLDLLLGAKLSPQTLFAGDGGDALKPVFAAIAERAREHLRGARRQAVASKAMPAMLPASLTGAYLRRIARPGFAPFRDPVDVPQWKKQLIFLAAATRGRI